MSEGVASAIKGAGIAAADEDLPTEARAPFREAVRALEFSMKKVSETSAILESIKKRMDKKNAD